MVGLKMNLEDENLSKVMNILPSVETAHRQAS